MLDERLLRRYMGGFYGYGAPSANLWFIGMEEGGGETEDAVGLHLRTWDKRGRHPFEDLRYFQLTKNPGDERFSEVARPQKTWKRLCLIELALRGHREPLDHAHQHQAVSLGRRAGANALLELLPLPKRSRDPRDWKYGEWTSIPWLRDPVSYERKVSAGRIERIASLLQEHRPRIVVFYGLSFRGYWSRLGLIDPQRVPIGTGDKSMYVSRSNRRTFVAVNHPADWLNHDYFIGVGAHLRRMGARP